MGNLLTGGVKYRYNRPKITRALNNFSESKMLKIAMRLNKTLCRSMV